MKIIDVDSKATLEDFLTFITHGFRVSVVSDVRDLRGYETSGSPLRFMLRRSSLVECVSVIHGTCVYKASICFIRPCSHVCQKILSTHFIP